MKSPEGCGRKGPRRWKESEDSTLEIDDLLPDKPQTGRHVQKSIQTEKEWTQRISEIYCKKTLTFNTILR